MAQQNGEMRHDLDPEAVAAHVMSIVGGLMTQRALASEELDIVSNLEQYIRSLSPVAIPLALQKSRRRARPAAPP